MMIITITNVIITYGSMLMHSPIVFRPKRNEIKLKSQYMLFYVIYLSAKQLLQAKRIQKEFPLHPASLTHNALCKSLSLQLPQWRFGPVDRPLGVRRPLLLRRHRRQRRRCVVAVQPQAHLRPTRAQERDRFRVRHVRHWCVVHLRHYVIQYESYFGSKYTQLELFSFSSQCRKIRMESL